jgi:glutaredoxin
VSVGDRPDRVRAVGDVGGAPNEGRAAGRIVVTLYTKPDCHLCDEALRVLRELRAELPFELALRDITRDEELHRAYFERIPVVCVDGEELCEYFVDAELLRERLESGRWPTRN